MLTEILLESTSVLTMCGPGTESRVWQLKASFLCMLFFLAFGVYWGCPDHQAGLQSLRTCLALSCRLVGSTVTCLHTYLCIYTYHTSVSLAVRGLHIHNDRKWLWRWGVLGGEGLT